MINQEFTYEIKIYKQSCGWVKTYWKGFSSIFSDLEELNFTSRYDQQLNVNDLYQIANILASDNYKMDELDTKWINWLKERIFGQRFVEKIKAIKYLGAYERLTARTWDLVSYYNSHEMEIATTLSGLPPVLLDNENLYKLFKNESFSALAKNFEELWDEELLTLLSVGIQAKHKNLSDYLLNVQKNLLLLKKAGLNNEMTYPLLIEHCQYITEITHGIMTLQKYNLFYSEPCVVLKELKYPNIDNINGLIKGLRILKENNLLTRNTVFFLLGGNKGYNCNKESADIAQVIVLGHYFGRLNQTLKWMDSHCQITRIKAPLQVLMDAKINNPKYLDFVLSDTSNKATDCILLVPTIIKLEQAGISIKMREIKDNREVIELLARNGLLSKINYERYKSLFWKNQLIFVDMLGHGLMTLERFTEFFSARFDRNKYEDLIEAKMKSDINIHLTETALIKKETEEETLKNAAVHLTVQLNDSFAILTFSGYKQDKKSSDNRLFSKNLQEIQQQIHPGILPHHFIHPFEERPDEKSQINQLDYHFFGSAFGSMAHTAFAKHQTIELRPDDIHLLILQGVARFIQKYPEDFRASIVTLKGKEKVGVTLPPYASKEDWSQVPLSFAGVLHQLVKNPDIANLLLQDYSQTSEIDKTVKAVTLMGIFSAYASFDVATMCFIPQFILRGSEEDWGKIYSLPKDLIKYFVLNEENKSQGVKLFYRWLIRLQPIVKEMYRARKGAKNIDFWQSFYKYNSYSGGNSITGNIIYFYPFLIKYGAHQECEDLQLNHYILGNDVTLGRSNGISYEGPHSSNLPANVVSVDFKWKDNNQSYEMGMKAGIVAFTETAKGALHTHVDYSIFYKNSQNVPAFKSDNVTPKAISTGKNQLDNNPIPIENSKGKFKTTAHLDNKSTLFSTQAHIIEVELGEGENKTFVCA